MIAPIDVLTKSRKLLSQNKLVAVFISAHLLFALFLGRLFALAPDESGYLYTFNNLYGSKDPNPQYNSGWITAPKPFLWITYLPAKILNILGVPDYLSIRILSIAIASLCLVLLINLKGTSSNTSSRFENWIFLAFFIPSIFLWTSVGLREVFILAEISLVLTGLSYLLRGANRRAVLYLSLGSYALLSTKNYLWVCLILSGIVVAVIWTLQGTFKKKLVGLGVGLVLVPCLAFASTTSIYALKFIVLSVFHSDLSSTAARSGDSVIQVAIPNTPGGAGGSSGKPNSGGGGIIGPVGGPQTTVVTFHGDTTLILLHFYLIDHPDAIVTRILRAVSIESKIQQIWEEKVKNGLVKKTVKAIPDSSSLSGYILKPGKLHNPETIFRPAFLFMFGPIPFLDQGGIALDTVALESPLWWLLYTVLGYRLFRYRRNGYWRDPVFQLATIYFLSLVAISALVEVNLGTSFRHRSILLVPLIVMFIRARGKNPAVAD